MKNNMTQLYEELIQTGLLRIRKGRLSLKRKGAVTKQQLLTHPNFAVSRKAMKEFGLCATGGRLLRRSLGEFANFDSHVHPRLHSLLHKILTSDTAHAMGSRSIMQGDISLLKGFPFNKHSTTHVFGFLGITSCIDPKKGKAILQVPQFNPESDSIWPEGAESMEIDSMLISLNFDEGVSEEVRANSKRIFRNGRKTASFKLVSEVNETKNRVLIHCVALRFFLKETNGKFYQIQNRNYTPAGIVGVERGK
jgi:hypothetical protein